MALRFTKARKMNYRKLILTGAVVATLACGCAGGPKSRPAAGRASPNSPVSALTPEAASAAIDATTQQVIAAERAFAKTMADRDFKAFVAFLSPEAVFFSGSTVRRGPAEVAAEWKSYFDPPRAPFSWAPDHVEVLPSGKLALSTGPVYEQGKIISRFNSIWRLEAPNTWRIVFDKGEAVCSASP
jgi:ketosteroid isomerase-like protein